MHDLKDYERDFTDLEACAQTKILANRMTLREGPQAPDVQRLGHITSSMANAVCQGYPKAPGEDPVLYLFSSLPSGWNAHIRGEYRTWLSGRGGSGGWYLQLDPSDRKHGQNGAAQSMGRAGR